MNSPGIRYSLSDEYKMRMAGERESVFRTIEDYFGIEIHSRDHGLLLLPLPGGNLQKAVCFLDQLKISLRQGALIQELQVKQLLEETSHPLDQANLQLDGSSLKSSAFLHPILRNRYGQPIQPKTEGQALLVQSVEQQDLIFVNGPAGTGKTFLAVALAVAWLEQKRVERICLVRPAVEAGENLGYLPGDLKEKIAPYLRPIDDALQEMLSPEKLHHYRETQQIEVAPLAYMRGRTLKRAFIILDEAQNTTIPQMKMFLTRLGARSKAMVVGDSSQTDLSSRQKSGLAHALRTLQRVKGIAQIQFTPTEVLRHSLVKEILTAYENEAESQPGDL